MNHTSTEYSYEHANECTTMDLRGAKMNDEKFMQASLVIDGALAGVAAFYSIPAALFMMALLIYAAINL